MKKISVVITIVISIFLFKNVVAQGNAEKVAKEVINAYKTQDLKLLKKYATGIVVYTMDDNYFNSEDGKALVEIAKNWDGTIKEIRYAEGDIMGKKVLLASAYFSDNKNGNLNVVVLSSYEKSDWKAFMYGITEATKEEFNEGSLEIPVKGKTTVASKTDHSKFSIEMANGDKFDQPTKQKLVELLKTLNDDNFFLILNSETGFLQASTSEKGYIVQYSDDEGMFEAEAYFTIDMLTEIFELYIDNGNWKDKAKWIEM